MRVFGLIIAVDIVGQYVLNGREEERWWVVGFL